MQSMRYLMCFFNFLIGFETNFKLENSTIEFNPLSINRLDINFSNDFELLNIKKYPKILINKKDINLPMLFDIVFVNNSQIHLKAILSVFLNSS